MTTVVPVVALIDESTGDEAMYVDGTLRLCEEQTIYAAGIAECVAGKVITFRYVKVDLPEGTDWPESLSECLIYRVKDGDQ